MVSEIIPKHFLKSNLVMLQRKSFFESLVDFSFANFIATRLVGIIYGISIVCIALAVLGIALGSFSQGFFTGLGALIISPLVGFLYLLIIRIALESMVAGIRTAENTSEIKEYLRQMRNERL
jgi:uncharacterized membrane protein